MSKSVFQMVELEAMLGSEFVELFDVDAIADELTEIDYRTGCRYWRDDLTQDEINAICQRYDRTGQN